VIAALLLALAQADPTSSVLVADKASQPSLALDADGACVVAFLRNGNVEIALSSDGGRTFAPPVTAIDAQGKARGGSQRGPRVSLDSRKRIYVTAPLAFAQTYDDLYAACSADGGKTFSKPLRVNEPPQTVRQSLHDSAAAPGGDLHVAWLDGRAADQPPAIYHCKVTDQAKKAGKNVQVAANASESAGPAIALDGRGWPSIAFLDGPKKGQEKKNRQTMLASTKSGSAPFSVAQLNREDTRVPVCPGQAPALGLSPDGKTLAAAWVDLRMGADDRNVFWTVGETAKLPMESPVHEDRRYYQGSPALAVDAAGTAWCCWEDGREGAQRVFFASSSYKGNYRVGPTTEEKGASPSVAAAGKRAAVAYENGAGVAVAVLAAP
jgi:hypothetical protein